MNRGPGFDPTYLLPGLVGTRVFLLAGEELLFGLPQRLHFLLELDVLEDLFPGPLLHDIHSHAATAVFVLLLLQFHLELFWDKRK